MHFYNFQNIFYYDRSAKMGARWLQAGPSEADLFRRAAALTGLLSHSLAFGPISSWHPEVFIEVGALAAGLPDTAMSSLVKVEGLTPFWLCPSSGQTSVRIQKHMQVTRAGTVP
nr:stereocilin-like isoform X2 [Oncorhynchus nerka]